MNTKYSDLFSMLDEANEKLRLLFRYQRKESLLQRGGSILLVDDMPEQEGLVRQMLINRKSKYPLLFASRAKDAMRIISERGNDGIHIVVVDVELSGGDNNTDGLDLIDWLQKHYPDIPYVILTGREETIPTIKGSYPGVDIVVKGHNTINDLADAMGLSSLFSDIFPTPKDKS